MRLAVIGRSEGGPVLYHTDKTRDDAELLCARRESARGRPCYVITMAAWQAEGECFGPGNG